MTRPVPGATGVRVLGWRDDAHVLVLDRDGRTVRSVDVVTGDAERVLALPGGGYAPGPVLAADALQGPAYDVPDPTCPRTPGCWPAWESSSCCSAARCWGGGAMSVADDRSDGRSRRPW